MSVLPGEGTHVILYGSTSFPTRATHLPAYLARPDLAGAYPAVVVVPAAEGVTSGIKDVARRLARHGLAVLVLDPYRGGGPGRRATPEEREAAFARLEDRRVLADLDAGLAYLRRPGTEWADPARLGVLGIGAGGRWVLLGAGEDRVRAIALAYTPLAGLDDAVVRVPLLGLYGRDDESVSASDVEAAHARLPQSEWVLYDGVGGGFLDDGSAGYDPEAAEDALERLVEFFAARLAVSAPTPR